MSGRKISGLGKFAVIATVVGVVLLIIAAIVNLYLDQKIQRDKAILISGSPEEKVSMLSKEQVRDILIKSGAKDLGIDVDTLTEDQMRNILRASLELADAQEDLNKLKLGIK